MFKRLHRSTTVNPVVSHTEEKEEGRRQKSLQVLQLQKQYNYAWSAWISGLFVCSCKYLSLHKWKAALSLQHWFCSWKIPVSYFWSCKIQDVVCKGRTCRYTLATADMRLHRQTFAKFCKSRNVATICCQWWMRALCKATYWKWSYCRLVGPTARSCHG